MKLPHSWVKGFIEGESSFIIIINKSKTILFGFQICPVFKIDLHEKDKIVLENIRDLYGVGTVAPQSNKRLRDKGINASDQYRYYVGGIKGCLKIRDEMLKDPFYSAKEKDFKIWSKIIDLLKEKEHLTIRGFLKICQMRDKMNVSLSRKHPKYRDYTWFKEYFSSHTEWKRHRKKRGRRPLLLTCLS